MRLRASLLAAALVLLELAGCRPPQPDSALLVVVDTLRADHLGLYGGRRPTSPNLDRRARRGLVFERAWATSPWTLPSVASLLTGRLPSHHGAGVKLRGADGRNFSRLAAEVPTVVEALRAAGLRTAAIVNNPFLDARFGVDRGFDTWDHRPGEGRKVQRADAVVDQVLAWLREQRDGRFFLLVHLIDPHLDYDAPAPFRGTFTGEEAGAPRPAVKMRTVRRALEAGEEVDMAFLEAAYDVEVAFVDAHLERLLAGLEELALDRRTLVVLTSDHGEEFGEHGGFEHGHSTFDEVARVPLVLWGPGIRAGRRQDPVTLLDVAPTLLSALGVAAPAELLGRSLLGSPGEQPCLVVERPLYGAEETALVRWPWKLRRERGSRASLFDLGRDPHERNDLARQRGDVAQRLDAALQRCTAGAPAAGAAATELDAELEEELRSLGYIE